VAFSAGGDAGRSPILSGPILLGLWVDRSENLNGNYAISDKPLSEQEWVEKHVKH
jgi:hypothetical protein